MAPASHLLISGQSYGAAYTNHAEKLLVRCLVSGEAGLLSKLEAFLLTAWSCVIRLVCLVERTGCPRRGRRRWQGHMKVHQAWALDWCLIMGRVDGGMYSGISAQNEFSIMMAKLNDQKEQLLQDWGPGPWAVVS